MARSEASKAQRREYYRTYMRAKRAQPDHVEPERDRTAYRKRYYEEHKEAILASNRAWRIANPERYKHYHKGQWRRQKERLYGASGKCSEAQWEARLEYHGKRCRYCGIELSDSAITRDHMIPLSRGGSAWPANLVPACMSCNSNKGSKTYFEFVGRG